MPHEESAYPAEWLRIAERDWNRAERLLGDEDPELSGFCLQQAVEKFLKAYLLARGWQLRRIHNLDALLDDAVGHDPTLESFRSACQKITAFYFVERYPFVFEKQITKEDIRSSIDQVKELIRKLRAGVQSEREETSPEEE